MKTMMRVCFLVFVLACYSDFALSQTKLKPKPKPSPTVTNILVTPTADEVLLGGSLTTNKYVNTVLGFSLDLPKGWFHHGEDDKMAVMDKGKAIIGADKSRADKRALDASAARSRVLFQLSSLLPGEAGSWAAFACGIERLPEPMSSNEYAAENRKLLLGQPTVKTTRANYPKVIGGASWTAFEVENDQAGVLVKQTFVATVRRGFAVFLVVSSVNAEHDKAIAESLNSIKFK